METRKVDIKWNGKDEVVEIKKLTFGELNRLRASASKLSIIGTQERVDINQVAMIENSLMESIVSAPFGVDSKTIQDLPMEIGKKLYDEFNDFHGIIPKKSVSSSTSSQAEKPATGK